MSPHHPHTEAAWQARAEQTRHCSFCGGKLETRSVPEHKGEVKLCSACNRVCFLNPKVAAGTLVLIDGKIVLARRSIEPGYGLWTFPGGFVDLGETPQEAAARETFEEVRLEVQVGAPAGVYISSGRDTVILVFWAEATGGTLQPADECLDARLFAPAEIPWDSLAFPSTRALLHEHFPPPR